MEASYITGSQLVQYLVLLLSEITGGTYTEVVWEQGAVENISTEEEWSEMRLEKTP
jgi:hypothetical protein